MEKGSLWRLVKESGVYAIGNVAIKASGLILAPWYLDTSLLSVAEYGYSDLLMGLGQLGVLLAGLGLGVGVLRAMSSNDFGDEAKFIPFSAMTMVLITAVLMVVVFYFADEHLSRFIFGALDRTLAIHLLGGYVFFKVMATVPLRLLRTNGQVGWYTISIVIEWTVMIFGVYYFMVSAGGGLEGIWKAYVLASGVSAVLLTAVAMSGITWKFKQSVVKKLVLFGAPLIISGTASLALNLGDRYIMLWILGAESVGLYGWAAKMAGTLNMFVVQSFQLSFSVLGMKAVATDGVKTSLHRRVFRHFVVLAGWATLGIVLLSYDITLLVSSDSSYLASEIIVLPYALGFMAFGLYHIAVNILLAGGDTKNIVRMVLGAAVLNVILNFALMPVFAEIGAAIATAISYLVLALFAAGVAKKKSGITYQWSTYVKVLIIVITFSLLGFSTTDWDLSSRLVARLGLILAFWPAIWAVQIYSKDEIDQAVTVIKKIIGSKKG